MSTTHTGSGKLDLRMLVKIEDLHDICMANIFIYHGSAKRYASPAWLPGSVEIGERYMFKMVSGLQSHVLVMKVIAALAVTDPLRNKPSVFRPYLRIETFDSPKNQTLPRSNAHDFQRK